MQPPLAAGPIELPPPPPDRPWHRARRRFRSRGVLGGLQHWLVVRGSILLVGFLALYVANGLVNGWNHAYSLSICNESPGQVPRGVVRHLLAWLLSLGGWLVAPTVAGAVGGYVLSTAITTRRRVPLAEAFPVDSRRPDA